MSRKIKEMSDFVKKLSPHTYEESIERITGDKPVKRMEREGKILYLFSTQASGSDVLSLLKEEFELGKKTEAQFHKDSKNYFRPACIDIDTAKPNSTFYKQSLAHYDNKTRSKMIALTPAEKIARNHSGRVSYYQPKSSNLEEMIKIVSFKPALFKYENNEFGPPEMYSETIFIPNVEDTYKIEKENKEGRQGSLF